MQAVPVGSVSRAPGLVRAKYVLRGITPLLQVLRVRVRRLGDANHGASVWLWPGRVVIRIG